MRSKILKMYKNEYDEFIKLVKLLYPMDNEHEGLQHVLWDKKNEDVSYFIINHQFMKNTILIDEIAEIAEKSRILKKFNLI